MKLTKRQRNFLRTPKGQTIAARKLRMKCRKALELARVNEASRAAYEYYRANRDRWADEEEARTNA